VACKFLTNKPRGAKFLKKKWSPTSMIQVVICFSPLHAVSLLPKKNQKHTPPKFNGRNLKIMVSKRNLLFQGLLFRFHVKFQGCTSVGDAGSCASTPSTELWREPLESGSSTGEVY